MRKIIKLNFAGQQIYVGIDVHKKSWSVSILTDELEHKTFTQPPDVDIGELSQAQFSRRIV